ncbi:alpha/beta hydrolase [Paraburkholderia sp. BL10I2N1]|uniref:alpha/beta fold hydrolase n=1 Tax=Paraburkholderia sp. BL10I2N1 TaxID=1938796 RepID=UPI0010616D96|nr:alpha/beta hydrolase [Paraburkholderia sp. BL10I2N1]TDN62773.1 pimeloyl-ACP methyl ester carboxylesterase [Paraburkholderia sp. BL10I2N1]
MDRLATNLPPSIAFAELPPTAERGPLRLEYQWLNPERVGAPLAIFLHEGLGSIALWKDWPQTLCDRLGFRGLVYSRPGYGRSTPREHDVKWPVDFMHRQAHDVLPAFLDALEIDPAERARMWLIGHSDGGSIALLYAAAFPKTLGGVIVVAPHVIVEQKSVDAIAEAKVAYEASGFREKLARYHDDVDSAFYGWNDIWLDADFRLWDITGVLASIECPLLALQGYDDEYGTMAQIDLIQQHVAHAQLTKLTGCGHSPHRQAGALLNDEIAEFINAP